MNHKILSLDMVADLFLIMDEHPMADIEECVDFLCDAFHLPWTTDLMDEVFDYACDSVYSTHHYALID